MSRYKDCDPFECYDALAILTRQGTVMTSNDVQLTIDEDAKLYQIGRAIASRTGKENSKSKEGAWI